MKYIIISLVLILTLILSGCGNQTTCNQPYIKVGNECCLDQNSNNICDSDEAESCSDECSENSCDGYNFISCLKQEDGCYDAVNKGKVVGACQVQCLDNSNCILGMECVNYKCENIEQCSDECSQDSCDNGNFVQCIESDGCKQKVDQGKVVGKCGIECLSDAHCSAGVSCTNNKCWSPPQTTN